MSNDVICGTCGLCGGPVVAPGLWAGAGPAPKICRDCGAHAREAYGPTLPMIKPTTDPRRDGPDWPQSAYEPGWWMFQPVAAAP